HRVHIGAVQQFVQAGRGLDGRVTFGDLGQILGLQVGHHGDLEIVDLAEIPHQVRAPVTVAHHADLDHGQAFPSRSRISPRTRAGTPATTAKSGTSFVTTAPAPTMAPFPMVTPQRMTAPLPKDAPSL